MSFGASHFGSKSGYPRGVSDDEFNAWVQVIGAACIEAPEECIYGCGCMIDDEEMATAFCQEDEFAAMTAEFNAMLTAKPAIGFLATKVMWSPTADGESSDAWALVVIEPSRPAWFGVRRLKEDERWRALPTDGVPWFMLSSASGLRHSLTTGESPVVKRTHDEQLMRTPFQNPEPPLDDRGLL